MGLSKYNSYANSIVRTTSKESTYKFTIDIIISLPIQAKIKK